MLLEKTLFQVDVLTLQIRFGPETAARLKQVARGDEDSEAREDSIVSAALDARDAFVRAEFLRSVDLDRFIESTRTNLRRAREAGIISPDAYRRISNGLPRWYDFLEERGIRAGDEILYRIRGDTLRSVYRTAEGGVPLDVTHTGRERRLSVVGSYLAPASDFRKDLLRSIFRSESRCKTGQEAGT